METTKQYAIHKYKEGKLTKTIDTVITEFSLDIVINHKAFITLLCTPESLKELVIGYIFSEGLINSKAHINSIEIDYKCGKAYVQLSNELSLNHIDDIMDGGDILTTSSGREKVTSDAIVDVLGRIERTTYYTPMEVVELMKVFDSKSQLFIDTGGVHSCALCDHNQILIFNEDIGRHNALDKVLGKALLEDINLQDKIILTSGRISSEIITKVAKRRIPVLISRSAPTNKAIDMARGLNMQLMGFVRSKKMNIYTN